MSQWLSKSVLEFKIKSDPEKMFLVSEKKNQITKQNNLNFT